MAFSLGDYGEIFLEEATDQLQELNQNLLEMENNPEDEESINNIFRAAHSLKSSAAFVGLNDLSDLSHKMENLLQGIRDKTMVATPEIIDMLFRCFDAINAVIDTVSEGEEPQQDLSGLIEQVTALAQKSEQNTESETVASSVAVPKIAAEKKATVNSSTLPELNFNGEERKKLLTELKSNNTCYLVTVNIDPTAQMKWIKASLILASLTKMGVIIKTIPDESELNDDQLQDVFTVVLSSAKDVVELYKTCDIDQIINIEVRRISFEQRDGKKLLKIHEKEDFSSLTDTEDEIVIAEPVVEKKEVKKVEVEKKPEHNKELKTSATPVLKTVKVSVDKLDHLLNNVAELVIANSGFYKLYEEIRLDDANKTIANDLKNRIEQMSRIAKDLQDGIMKTRMVPIGQVFSRFNRLVRDLSKEFDKKISFVVKGEETELDKKVIDAIGEPLIHLIRNAVDHGIEDKETRKEIGKNEAATLGLTAYQGGNQIFIEVSDDGRGLNLQRIKQKAIERELATPESLQNMEEEDIYAFIFNPGFSTAEKITDVSGRGVGMNVVKEIVSELNGSISIQTEYGMGTSFTLSFPLTMAIMPAIMIKICGELYAVPLSDVIDTIKIENGDISTIEGHEVINLRGEILSLLRLNEFVGYDAQLEQNEKIPVVVVGYGNRKIGLIVDSLEGKQEIVIKSLEKNYKNVEGLAGASILGDGSICLILDTSSMINKCIADQERLSQNARNLAARKVSEASIEKIQLEPLSETEEVLAQVEKQTDYIQNTKSEENADTSELEIIEEVDFELNVKSEGESVPEKKLDKTEVETIIIDDVETDVEKQTTVVDEITPDKPEIGDSQVQNVLDNFKEEMRSNLQSSLNGGVEDQNLKNLGLTAEDFNKYRVLANIGITNAAESLSMILNKNIELSIPYVNLLPIEKIPESFGEVDSVYLGVYMPLVGAVSGTVLFSLKEQIAYDLVDSLFGTDNSENKELSEEGESALKEITNIIGSSVVNVFAEKSKLALQPDVPTLVHDFMQSIIDSILVMHNLSNDYAVVMETEFFYENDRLIGNLLILPETESLKKLVEAIR